MADTDIPDPHTLPLFPAPSIAPFDGDPERLVGLITPALTGLSPVVTGSLAAEATAATPCAEFDVAALRDHILGWLQYFAVALSDPSGGQPRLDADAYRAADDPREPAEVVRAATDVIADAIRGGVQGREVAMSRARMSGPAVLGMLLGEYLVHGWDLARATGQGWDPAAEACEAADRYFRELITPEYRGPGAFFGEEVPVPEHAPPLHRLLGFAGRDPSWSGAAG